MLVVEPSTAINKMKESAAKPWGASAEWDGVVTSQEHLRTWGADESLCQPNCKESNH